MVRLANATETTRCAPPLTSWSSRPASSPSGSGSMTARAGRTGPDTARRLRRPGRPSARLPGPALPSLSARALLVSHSAACASCAAHPHPSHCRPDKLGV